MKTAKYLFIILIGTLLYACNDISIGYLETQRASYNPDSLIVKQFLDLDKEGPHEDLVENPDYRTWINLGYDHDLVIQYYPQWITGIVTGEDYDRFENNAPWVGLPMEGVLGTFPLIFTVEGATKVGGGSVEEFLKYTTCASGGAIAVELEHDIPSGEYLVNVTVSNEGHSQTVEKIFKVIVK